MNLPKLTFLSLRGNKLLSISEEAFQVSFFLIGTIKGSFAVCQYLTSQTLIPPKFDQITKNF